jgi:hypothetical protein
LNCPEGCEDRGKRSRKKHLCLRDVVVYANCEQLSRTTWASSPTA